MLFQLEDQGTGLEITDKLMPAMRILMFLSYRLADAKTRYNTGEKETLGMITTRLVPHPFRHWIIPFSFAQNLEVHHYKESKCEGALNGHG